MRWLNKRRHVMRPRRPRRYGWLRWFCLVSGALMVLVIIAGGIAGMMAYRSLAAGLPELDELETYQSSLVTHVYDRHGQLSQIFLLKNES